MHTVRQAHTHLHLVIRIRSANCKLLVQQPLPAARQAPHMLWRGTVTVAVVEGPSPARFLATAVNLYRAASCTQLVVAAFKTNLI